MTPTPLIPLIQYFPVQNNRNHALQERLAPPSRHYKL